MSIDLDKLEQAKQDAISQGFDPKDVETYANTVIAKQEKKDKYIQDAAEAVRSGYPGESIPQEYRMDVYNRLGNTGYDTPFTATERAAGTKEVEEEEDIRTEVKLWKAKAKDWSDLSDDARSLALDIGEEPPKELSTEERTASAKSKVIARDVQIRGQAVLDVINRIESGELKGVQAQVELEYAGANFNKTAFVEGGKTFSPTEKSMIAGSLITIEEQNTQNIIQRLTGDVPEPTSKVMDNTEKIKAKMNIAINGASQILGVEEEEPALNLSQQSTPQPTPQPTQQPTQQSGFDYSQPISKQFLERSKTSNQQPTTQKPGFFTPERKEKGIDILNRMADFAPGVMAGTAGVLGSMVGTPVLGAVAAGAGYGAGLAIEEGIENLTGRQDETQAELAKESVYEPLKAGALDYIFGKAFKLAGKLVPDKFKKILVQKLAGIDKKVWLEYGESTGDDLVESAGKWFQQSSSWDDLIGTTSNKFSEGIMHTAREEAEEVIKKGVAAAGDDIVVGFNVFEELLEKDMESLGAVGGNEVKREAMEKVIEETRKIYPNGLTAKNLLDLKRAGDKKFGDKVISPSVRESAANYIQKRLSNIARNILKENFDDIADALDLEHEILELVPIFKNQVAREAVEKNLLPSLRGSGISGAVKSVAESKAMAKSLGIGLDIGEHFLPPAIVENPFSQSKSEENLSNSPGFMYR